MILDVAQVVILLYIGNKLRQIYNHSVGFTGSIPRKHYTRLAMIPVNGLKFLIKKIKEKLRSK